jgi:hypothetical protein
LKQLDDFLVADNATADPDQLRPERGSVILAAPGARLLACWGIAPRFFGADAVVGSGLLKVVRDSHRPL